MFFLYGYGGTGKTFMWKTLAYALCLIGDIVLTVASSGIALLLLPNGRTAYLKFVIPMPTLENSTCNIHQGTEQAELLKATKLVICDEAPMAHKYYFAACLILTVFHLVEKLLCLEVISGKFFPSSQEEVDLT